MDSVDEIMLALAEKYAVEKNERWSLAREGSAIGKAVIFWLNNQKELRSFLHDPRICPDNNQVERSVRAVAVYRNVAFFKKSIEDTKGFCNLLTLRETAKLNGIKDVSKWLNAVHRAFYGDVERSVWTARYERLKDGEPLRLRIPNITPELIASFDWTPWLPWIYAKALPGDLRLLPIHAPGTLAQAGAPLRAAPKFCNCFNEINENNALGFLLCNKYLINPFF